MHISRERDKLYGANLLVIRSINPVKLGTFWVVLRHNYKSLKLENFV